LSRLPFELIGDHRDRAVGLIANHAAAAVLARELTAFIVEGIAIAVAGRITEHRHARVVFDPAQLHVGWNVAPHQILTHTVPGGTFSPGGSGVEPFDAGVADHIAPEARVESDDVRVGILDRNLAGPVALRCHWRWRRRGRSLRGGSGGKAEKRPAGKNHT
jgi:hypothetical protein